MRVDRTEMKFFTVLTDIGPGHEKMAFVDSKKSKDDKLVFCQSLMDVLNELNYKGEFTLVFTEREQKFRICVSSRITDVIEIED